MSSIHGIAALSIDLAKDAYKKTPLPIVKFGPKDLVVKCLDVVPRAHASFTLHNKTSSKGDLCIGRLDATNAWYKGTDSVKEALQKTNTV